jgi:hypothetical protein
VLSVYFKVTEPSPLQDSFSVRQKGGLPGLPPVVPHPESIAAQAAYAEAQLPGTASGPNCFQALGSSPGLLQRPIL